MDLPDKLNPANAVAEENLQKLSHEDFQKLLRGWFENSGLITETRSYLRMQLIRMLNTTKLGLQTSRPREPVSQKVQILNMLVAEHLLRYKYLYTLSMFSNEMSTLSVPPEFNFLFVTEHGDGSMRFEKNQVLRILNFLNAAVRREVVEHIFSEYYDCHDESNGPNGCSLLLCLLDNLPSSMERIPDVEDYGVISVMRHLRHLLEEIKAPHHVTHGIETTIQQFISNLEHKYNSDSQKNLRMSGEKPLEIEKRDVGTQKFDGQHRPAEREEMKLISLHNEKTKMIRRIYKYRISQMEKLQQQLEEKLKDFDGLKDPLAKVEKCSLKHCDGLCEETRNRLDIIKTENRKLKQLVKDKSDELKILELKLVRLATALTQAQNKLATGSHSRTASAEEDTFTETEVSDKESTEKGRGSTAMRESDTLDTLFQDIYKKLDSLEYENDMIDTEYKLFKKTTLP